MKRSIVIFFLILPVFFAQAQTKNQKGVVESISYVYGQAGSPIEDVILQVLTEVRSDAKGNFEVPVNDSPDGVFSFSKIQKNGYTLISPSADKLLEENFAINSSASVRIVMASRDALYKERRRIEANMRNAYENSISAKDEEISAMKFQIDSLKALAADVEALEETVKAKQEELDKFKEEYYNSDEQIVQQAKTLSEIDYSGLTEIEAKIVELKKDGKGVEAAELAKSQISSKMWKKINTDPAALKRAAEKKRKDYEEAEKMFSESRKMLFNTFDGYRIACRHEDAAHYLKLYADMDPSDYEGILAYTSYLISALERFDDAVEYLSVILNDPNAPVKYIVDAKTHKANIASARGFRDDALAKYEEALDLALRDSVISSIISLENNIGKIYNFLDNFEQAEAFYREALCFQHNPEMTIKLLTSIRLGLSEALVDQNRTDEAKKYLDLVSEDLDLLKQEGAIYNINLYYSSLSYYFSHIGDRDGRLEACKKALEVSEAYYGPKHTNLAVDYSNLAEAYLAKGEYDAAFKYLKKGRDVYAETVGTHHPNYINMSVTYYKLLYKRGRYQEALNGLLHLESEMEGNSNLNAIQYHVFQMIAVCYSALGDSDNASEYYSRYLQRTIDSFGENNTETAWAYNSLGAFYFREGDYEKSCQSYEKCLSVLQAALPDDNIELATPLQNLGVLYSRIGDHDKALATYKRALLITQNGGNDPLTEAQILSNIGVQYNEAGIYDEALGYMDKAYEIYSSTDDYLEIVNTLLNTAIIYLNKHDLQKVVETANRGLNLAEQTIGTNNRLVARLLQKLGFASFFLGDDHTVETALNKAIEIFKEKGDSSVADDCIQYLDEVRLMPKTHLFIGIVVEGSPASKRGLNGEYYVLKYNSWDCKSEKSLSRYSISVKSEDPKIIVLLSPDGAVIEERFETGKMGINWKIKEVSEAQRAYAIEAFEKYLSRAQP